MACRVIDQTQQTRYTDPMLFYYSMGHRLRRRSNIKATLFQCIVFVRKTLNLTLYRQWES